MKKTNILQLMAILLFGGLLLLNFLSLHSEKTTILHTKNKRGVAKNFCYCTGSNHACATAPSGLESCTPFNPPCADFDGLCRE